MTKDIKQYKERIICAKCDKEVDYWEYFDDPMNNNRITTVKCHGETETRALDLFLFAKEFNSIDIKHMPLVAFNEFQTKQLESNNND
jgi:hypothetical protein